MLKRQTFSLLLVLALFALLVFGIAKLFSFREQEGDVYPEYCSLRADPVGLKALYESLGATPGLQVYRNYRPLVHFESPNPVTLFYAGVTAEAYWDRDELVKFSTLMTTGGRSVFAFSPLKPTQTGAVKPPPKPKKKTDETDDKKKGDSKSGEEKKKTAPEKESKAKGANERPEKDEKKEKEKDSDGKEDEKESDDVISFYEVGSQWKFKFELNREFKESEMTAVATQAASALEPKLVWRSALYFGDLGKEWRVLYKCQDKPVLIQRPWGKGSIILASDTDFLTNEALRGSPCPKLIAAMIGPPTIVFDEEHNGISERSSVATLLGKQHLQGAFAALLLVGFLFLWQCLVRFVPPYDPRAGNLELVGGQDAASGFVSLLRRSVPKSGLISTCIAEWRRVREADSVALAKFEKATSAVPADPVEAYRFISQQMSAKKKQAGISNGGPPRPESPTLPPNPTPIS